MREQSLERALVLVRMLRRQPRQGREPLVPLRVVLHRARPERVEVRVDRHVQRREVRVVPDDVELAQFGQGRRRPSPGATAGISSSSGRSGTSDAGKIAVERPGRLVSKRRAGGSSLYIDFLPQPRWIPRYAKTSPTRHRNPGTTSPPSSISSTERVTGSIPGRWTVIVRVFGKTFQTISEPAASQAAAFSSALADCH